ncbi:Orf130 [Heliothis zea nudivirus]|uniref:Orf130 n=1 Tax=Heliothis zea nudivirus 1 TaxID=3116536 RepID=Q8JKI3_9VIRU|nr:Orf130 [Heliothis zea nudivirus]AAN04423.1 Orf130 [Heliothis zea nudivirus]WCZ68499.1 hypothetical protein HvNV019 [Heliothis virescens nudivirus]
MPIRKNLKSIIAKIFKKRFNAKSLESIILDALSDVHHARVSMSDANSPLDYVDSLREKICAYHIPKHLKAKLFHRTLPPDYYLCPGVEGVSYTGYCKRCDIQYRYPNPLSSLFNLSNLYCVECCGDLFDRIDDLYVF